MQKRPFLVAFVICLPRLPLPHHPASHSLPFTFYLLLFTSPCSSLYFLSFSATVMPMINVQVEKNPAEAAVNILRRFTKRVQGSGVLSRIRSIRYAERSMSRYTKKKFALKSLRNREAYGRNVKLGKIRPERERAERAAK